MPKTAVARSTAAQSEDRIKVVIVDDDAACRKRLKRLLAEGHPDAEILGMAATVPDGVAQVKRFEPDLVFLDIHFGKGQPEGWDLFDGIAPSEPSVIFTTEFGSAENAIRAFDFSSIGFLKKPIQPKELDRALAKARRHGRPDDIEDQITALRTNSAKHKHVRLPVTERRKGKLIKNWEVLERSEIIYCETDKEDKHFVNIHTTAEPKVLCVRANLKSLEGLLNIEWAFVRIYHSVLLNATHVKRMIFDDDGGSNVGEGGVVVLKDMTRLPVSGDKKKDLLEAMDAL